MILKANLREAARSLAASRQRSILALLGIVIGIASVIALVSIGSLAQRESMRQFMEMGTDILSIQREQGRGDRESSGFQLQDILAIPESLPSIDTVAPYASSYGELRKDGKRMAVPLLGVTASFLDMNKLAMIEGRFISDLDGLTPHACLSSNLAQKLKAQGIATQPGSELYYENRRVTVVGTLASAPMGGMRPYEIQEGLLLPLPALLRMPSQSGIHTFMARLTPGFSTAQGTAEIRSYFSGLPGKTELRIMSPEEIIAHMERQFRMFTLLLGAIGSISLIVGGVGVMNVMLVSVTERKREIGIRRALGARKKDIQWQFLIESVLLSLVGGLVGSLIGVATSWGIARFSGWQFELIHGALILGVGVSVAIGIFFGYYPARQAAALNPIQALRTD
ncbi:ABC transporter permease [Desulfobotulus sp.]|jgi:putative ABC transport system permease protein|uniref:ABC transporter permease n=1 Tax=Desulfobotulus sp. TaxID=1940337 RepID=UPI002A365064|nr:ABC transporter permease [Desulfobotulus sp.]MDY0162443.1 ABC transporter permease [Desulfobotulus sp.]